MGNFLLGVATVLPYLALVKSKPDGTYPLAIPVVALSCVLLLLSFIV
jgi:hypothetical protein